MRYSKEHKAETRQRILDVAAPLLRRDGFSAVSVDKLMRAADLTRGGFYAHFQSKEQLIESILSRNAGLVRMLDDREGGEAQELNAQALSILKQYLDPQNLDEIIEGCPLATMPIDATRSSPRLRGAYGQRFWALIEQLKRGFGKRKRDEEDAIVAAVIAVGGIVFARATTSVEHSAKIEAACAKHIATMLDAT